MAATEVLEQRVADLVLLAEIRELVLQTIVLLDDADDKIQEAPHLLEKIGIDDTTIAVSYTHLTLPTKLEV